MKTRKNEKTKKISRKLVFKKSTVSNLNSLSMGRVYGGKTNMGDICGVGPTQYEGCNSTCNYTLCPLTCNTTCNSIQLCP